MFPWNKDHHERSRRAASVPISFQQLGNLLMMPKGMTITHIDVDHAIATAHLVVAHPEIEPVLDGDQIPNLNPVVSELDYGLRRETDWGELGTVSRPDLSETWYQLALQSISNRGVQP